VTSREAILLLEKFRAGQVGRDEVLRAFQAAPTADLGFAQVDLHRSLRKNFPEVIFGSGKTPAQVVAIATRLAQREKRVLITRIGQEHSFSVPCLVPGAPRTYKRIRIFLIDFRNFFHSRAQRLYC